MGMKEITTAKYDIHLEKLDAVCDLLDQRLVFGNVINHCIPNGEPYIEIWKGPYSRRMESDFCESDILFKIFWYPITKKYCLKVFDTDYSEKIRLMCQPDECWLSNSYLFKTPQIIVDIIEALFSHKENINMNKDQKRGEAINSLIHELTIRKIEWKSLGVIHGYPTIRIYNKGPIGGSIADIYVLATNSEYVYAIEPDTYSFRDHLKNSKYRYARTYPCTNDWYVYITARTVGCVVKDFFEMSAPDPEPKIFDKLSVKDVIFNDPATIVIWADGSKTVVKANGEKFDPEKGLAMAISKKVLGNKHDYYELFKKHVGRYEKKQNKKR